MLWYLLDAVKWSALEFFKGGSSPPEPTTMWIREKTVKSEKFRNLEISTGTVGRNYWVALGRFTSRATNLFAVNHIKHSIVNHMLYYIYNLQITIYLSKQPIPVWHILLNVISAVVVGSTVMSFHTVLVKLVVSWIHPSRRALFFTVPRNCASPSHIPHTRTCLLIFLNFILEFYPCLICLKSAQFGTGRLGFKICEVFEKRPTGNVFRRKHNI